MWFIAIESHIEGIDQINYDNGQSTWIIPDVQSLEWGKEGQHVYKYIKENKRDQKKNMCGKQTKSERCLHDFLIKPRDCILQNCIWLLCTFINHW